MERRTGFRTKNGKERKVVDIGSELFTSCTKIEGPTGSKTQDKTRASAQNMNILLYDNFKYRVETHIDPPSRRQRGVCEDRGAAPPKKARCMLIESFLGKESIVGTVEGWRMNALLEVDRHFSESDNRERGYRLFLAVKLLQTVKEPKAWAAVEVLKGLTLEETIFWVWQYHSYGNRALGALKHIHLR